MDLPHDIISIEVGQYFATFLAVEARKGVLHFEEPDEWTKYSIYNYQVEYLHEPYEQVYFFN